MHRLQKAGWSIRHAPASQVFHIGGASTGLREGKALSAPSFPLYWFESRRRFFALAYGPFKAWLAGIFWIIGTFVGQLAGLIRSPRADHSAFADMKQMLRLGLWPTFRDSEPVKISAGDRRGIAPRWMEWQGKGKNAE